MKNRISFLFLVAMSCSLLIPGKVLADSELNLDLSTGDRLYTVAEVPISQPVDSIQQETPVIEPAGLAPALPFLGDKARSRGYELPLSLGTSLNYLFVSRDVAVHEVRAGLNGAPLQEVSALDFNVGSDVQALIARFDVWLFPFLNVYVMAGSVQNDSDVGVTVTLQPPGPVPPRQESFTIPAHLSGPTYGGGLTLAGGFDDFFMTWDTNLSYTDLGGLFDHEIEALVSSVRAGQQLEHGDVKWRWWLGGTYWGTETTLSGSIDLPSGDTVAFEVAQGPKTPANFNLGGMVEFNRHFSGLVDFGFYQDVRSLMVGVSGRF